MVLQAEQLSEHWGAMVRSARSILESRDEAEECAGQALMQVCEQDVSNVLNMEAYMVTVAKRRAIDRRRSLERSRRRDQLLAAQDRLVLNDLAEDVAQRLEATWMAREAVRLLDPRSFDILSRYAEDETMASIAATHDLTEGAARTVLHRARKLLREVYAKGLAVLGLGWLVGRRLGPAAPVAAALATAAVSLVLSPLVPHVEPTPGAATAPPGTRVTLESAITPTAHRVAPSARPVLSGQHHARAKPKPAAVPTPAAREVIAVAAPLGAKTVITPRQRGDDTTYDDPVTILVDCLEHFRLTEVHVGC